MYKSAVFPLFVICLLAGLAVYFPGLRGGFLFDDVANITANPRVAIQDLNPSSLRHAAYSGESGRLGRPISMVSFALNYYLAGLDPFFFKLTNLFIHLLNGTGIFLLTQLLLRAYRVRFRPDMPPAYPAWIGLMVAAAWLLHPLNLTSVLYVVQRMTSLSALFAIYGLTMFVWGRSRLAEGRGGYWQMLSSLLIFTPLAALSKENGLLLPFMIFAAEAVIFTFKAPDRTARRFLLVFYGASVVIPAVLAIAYVVMRHEGLFAGYDARDFSMNERLMTEARVIWYYISQIIVPDLTRMGLFLDDFAISRGFFQPVSTVISVIGLAVLACTALLLRNKHAIFSFGVLFFLAGHLMESTIFPLEIAYEHRNYLPMYGIILPLFYYLSAPMKKIGYLRARQSVGMLLVLVLAIVTYVRSSAWSNTMDLFQAEYRHHPGSARNNVELGHLYGNIKTNDPALAAKYMELSRQHFINATRLDENDTGGLFGLLMSSAIRGSMVEQTLIHELAYRLEHAPFAMVTSDKLLVLTLCQLRGECRVSSSDLGRLLQAALDNPTLWGGSRTKVLYGKSLYQVNIERDYDGALRLMRQMVESSPNEIAPRMALINFLLALDKTELARDQIGEVRKLGLYGPYIQEVAQIESQIEKDAQLRVNP